MAVWKDHLRKDKKKRSMELLVVKSINRTQQASTHKCIRLHRISSQVVLRSTEREAVKTRLSGKVHTNLVIWCLDLHGACIRPPSAPSSDVSTNKVNLHASGPIAIFTHLLDIQPMYY